MKKIFLATLFLFFGTSTVSAFDGEFLDQIQQKIYEDHRISVREARMLLTLSSESPQEETAAAEQEIASQKMMSSEDNSVQEINDPVYTKARRDFSFLIAPQKEAAVSLFEISGRDSFSNSLEMVRRRQYLARKKALKYYKMFRD